MSAASAIKLLRAVIQSPECAQMNRSTVKGFLGELLVKKRLQDEGIEVSHLGNQFGFDLSFSAGSREIRVDVKMSLPKDEFSWGTEYWGWALVHENKKKALSASHFVCVGCSADLEIDRLFVVSASSASGFPRGIRQFSKVKHALFLPCDPALRASALKQSDESFVTECEKLRRSGVIREVKHGSRLRDALV